MFITRETDYALRILRALADGNRRNLSQVCEQQMVPSSFAYKIIRKLEKAGYLTVSRGTGGGCTLTADLQALTLFDLLGAMGEDCRINACIDPAFDCSWRNRYGACPTNHCLCEIQRTINAELQRHTLHQLLFSDEEGKPEGVSG